MNTPTMSCATVPTTISVSAVVATSLMSARIELSNLGVRAERVTAEMEQWFK